VASPIVFSSAGSTVFASSALSNAEAISSGPLTPGPKPWVRPS
jgi:hypothetical protein